MFYILVGALEYFDINNSLAIRTKHDIFSVFSARRKIKTKSKQKYFRKPGDPLGDLHHTPRLQGELPETGGHPRHLRPRLHRPQHGHLCRARPGRDLQAPGGQQFLKRPMAKL